jgi:hypothetical protein
MPSFRHWLICASIVPTMGCGTICNLKDPADGPLFMGSGSCYPFGGTTRSAMLAGFGTAGGIASAFEGSLETCTGKVGEGTGKVVNGAAMTAFGLVAVVDTPLSFAGDVVTFPIAYGRMNKEPWASWWRKPERHPGPDSIVPRQIHEGAVGPVSPALAAELEELERQSEIANGGGAPR